MANDRIERMHFVDLDIAYAQDGVDESLDGACAQLTVGLLIQHSVLIPAGDHGVMNQWPVVRFVGSRNHLTELLNRYDGVSGAFDPSQFNPNWPVPA